MRKTALMSLFVVAILAMTSSKASADALGLLQIEGVESNFSMPIVLEVLEAPQKEPEAPVGEPATTKHVVVDNESLSKIAAKHQTTWKRLFDKNEAIEHPDVINAGDELVVPRPEEELASRPLPLPPQEPAPATRPAGNNRFGAQNRTAARPATRQPAQQVRGSTSGNLYTPGYCTWYAKNRRPDLPNNLGNADTWVARARAQGLPTGSAPRAGAIGQQGMHVVYVDRVNNDGTVTISEMNFKGLYVVSSRTVPAGNFQYIY